ncbi:MAG: protein kinase family protein, partial [Oscillospiraceae bacterium]|nr:protein kinase family protein [Oscillospiraceae bacterium]
MWYNRQRMTKIAAVFRNNKNSKGLSGGKLWGTLFMEEHTNGYNAIATPWSRQSEYEQVLYTLKEASKVAGKGIASQIDLIRGAIGYGAHSVVYIGELKGSKRLITVKYDQRDFSKNFRDIMLKIEILQRIDHPYIPKLLDFIPDGEKSIILMEYTPGESLQHRLNHVGVTQGEALEWTCQILDALDYLHKGIPVPQKDWSSSKEDVEKVIHIIHGNISTDNILLTPVREGDGTIKFQIRLIDFRLTGNKIIPRQSAGNETFGNAWVERSDGTTERGGLTKDLHKNKAITMELSHKKESAMETGNHIIPVSKVNVMNDR